MKTIVVVNGMPRSGKDTVVRMMGDILSANHIPWAAFSSIDPVRNMLTHAGFDLTQKTDADRDLLQAVGAAAEKHSHWRSQRCIVKAVNFFESVPGPDAVMFLHVREAEVIDRIKTVLAGWPAATYNTLKVQVRSPKAKMVTSNPSDANTADIEYDYTIDNDGSLDDLARRSDKALFTLGVTQQLSLLP